MPVGNTLFVTVGEGNGHALLAVPADGSLAKIDLAVLLNVNHGYFGGRTRFGNALSDHDALRSSPSSPPRERGSHKC